MSRLADFLHANGRRVLAVAVVAAAIAGAFGASVANDMSPYGADDPATESVQATHRFEHATGRQIDAGVVALVQSGEVRSSAATARVGQVAGELRAQPDVARVVTYYDTQDPAMVSRDGRSTYVLAYFKPRSDKALQDVAKQIEKRFHGQPEVKLGGEAVAGAQINTQVGHDLAHAELLAFPFIFLLSWPPSCRRCWAPWRSSRRSSRCAWWRPSRTSRCSR
jgi:RND superfamily putative drug exporter